MLSRSQLITAHPVIDKSGSLANGYAIPVLGFGTYRIAPKDAYDTIRNALRCGYRHFDCAKAYNNEGAIGRALQDGMRELKIKREDLFITSKLWQTDHRPERVEAACRMSIERLQCGYLDLLLMHWPVAWKALPKSSGSNLLGGGNDPDADVNDEEMQPVDPASGQCIVDHGVTIFDTWQAMEALTRTSSGVAANGKGLSKVAELVAGRAVAADSSSSSSSPSPLYSAFHQEQQKKHPLYQELLSRPTDFEPLVRSLGLSNFNEHEIEALSSDNPSVRPVCNQIELHPGLPQTKLKAVHGFHRLVTCAYCPLGMPTRFTNPDFTGVVNDPFFRAFEKRTGFTPARLLLNWSVDLGHVVLVKAQSLKNMQDNAKVQKFALRDALRFIFDQYHTLRPVRVINPTTFRGDGMPFFPPDPCPRGAKPSIIEAYEEAVKLATAGERSGKQEQPPQQQQPHDPKDREGKGTAKHSTSSSLPGWASQKPDPMSISSGEGPLTEGEIRLRERVAAETVKRKAEAERLEKLAQDEKRGKEKKEWEEQQRQAQQVAQS